MKAQLTNVHVVHVPQMIQELHHHSLIRVCGKAVESRDEQGAWPLSGSLGGNSCFFGFLSWQMNSDINLR